MTETYLDFHIEEAHGRKAGDVIRAGETAFADCVILGFNDSGDAKLARPFARAAGVGTTGPTALTGIEVFVVFGATFAASLTLYKTVDSSAKHRI